MRSLPGEHGTALGVMMAVLLGGVGDGAVLWAHWLRVRLRQLAQARENEESTLGVEASAVSVVVLAV